VSRIEEALRRAGRASTASNAAAGPDDMTAPADAAGLDLYPREPRAAAVRPGPPHEGPGPRATDEPARLLPNRREPDRRIEDRTPRSFPQRASRHGQRIARPEEAEIKVTIEVEPARAEAVSQGGGTLHAERYRGLAAALREMQDRSAWTGAPGSADRGLTALFVTSAMPGEGKSQTVANLAVALAAAGDRKVLVIDAGLHAPSLHDFFGLPNGPGLSEFLGSGGDRLRIRQVSASVSLLTAGRASPGQSARASGRFRALLAECASRFDWILIDLPPASQLTGAHPLRGSMRAVLFVIRSRVTPVSVVDRAMAEIGRGSVVGTVLNAVHGR